MLNLGYGMCFLVMNGMEANLLYEGGKYIPLAVPCEI